MRAWPPVSTGSRAPLIGISSSRSHDNTITGNDISDARGGFNLSFSWNNQIADISFLSSLTNLTKLNLHSNQIVDVSPLSNLTDLEYLQLYNNQISDLSPLASLTSLTFLHVSRNEISDISSLAFLTNLTELDLHVNQISDLSPLVENSGLSSGDVVYPADNPLSEEAYVRDLSLLGPDVKSVAIINKFSALLRCIKRGQKNI